MLEDCLFASSLFSIFGGIAKVKAIENIRNSSLNVTANRLCRKMHNPEINWGVFTEPALKVSKFKMY